MTPTALAAGTHTLQVNYQVVAGSYRGDAVFQGLTLDSGATTFAAPAPAKLIEFAERPHRVRLADRRAARYRAHPDWDFSRSQADAVVINLDTNDVGHGVSTPQFQSAYSSLLRKVRAAYPRAWILALETFRGRYVPQTEAAVKAAVDGGDSRLSFVDTTGWLGAGDLTDSVHPNDQGHRVIADRLAPVIAARIGG